MQGNVKIKLANRLVRIPRFIVRRLIAAEAKRMRAGLEFMGPDHHALRNFVVTKIASDGVPVSAATIASAVGLSRERVHHILDELERNVVFVARGEDGDVTWAYPVTSDVTTHRIEYADAKPTYGA